MYADALVLNRNYQAIHVTGWQKSITMLFQGHAKAVDEDLQSYDFKDWTELSKLMHDDPLHPEKFVHSAHLRVAVPRVIVLTKYDRLPQREVKFTRRALYVHYGGKCCYCGKKFYNKELNLDHVVPQSKGGKSTWDNVVTACFPCNSRKADKSPAEVGMKLLVKPSKPKWKGVGTALMESLGKNIPVSWQALIDRAYWDGELE